ncbi:hypothetical protein F5B20DRAFT_545018 [Whalleya microplaca]|nr:hypothetical protein F5B20DRAFT_545018 [Whalleya microplaca]
MVQMYTIFGRQVGSHYVAMGVLTALFGGGYYGLSGGSKKPTQTPPINAASPDEADFIQYAARISRNGPDANRSTIGIFLSKPMRMRRRGMRSIRFSRTLSIQPGYRSIVHIEMVTMESVQPATAH